MERIEQSLQGTLSMIGDAMHIVDTSTGKSVMIRTGPVVNTVEAQFFAGARVTLLIEYDPVNQIQPDGI